MGHSETGLYYVISSVLSFVAALLVCYLSFLENGRSVRPSTCLVLYLLVSSVCDGASLAAQPRLRGHPSPKVALTCGCVIVKLVLLLLESQSKRPILRDPYAQWPPEALAGVLNRGFSWWVNGVLIKGNVKILSRADLPSLDDELSSERLRREMQKAWKKRSKAFLVVLSSILLSYAS